MFGKKKEKPLNQGELIFQELVKALVEFNATMKSIEGKIDTIYEAYTTINKPE